MVIEIAAGGGTAGEDVGGMRGMDETHMRPF